MKVLRIVGHNIRDAFKNVFRNLSLSIASVSSITITLLIVAIAVIASYNVNNFAKMIKKDFTIVVFLDRTVTAAEIETAKDSIENLDNIDSVTFESKEQVAAGMKDSSEVFNNIMSDWEKGENPLQDTFLIKVKNLDKIEATANILKEIDNVSIVKYGEGMVDQMLAIFKVLEKALIITVVALILVTAFLIANTIKITIFSRKKEIEIMRLVGASNFNIKQPFILEGLYLGILGSIIPITLSVYGYYYVYSHFDGRVFSQFIRLVEPEPFIFQLSAGLLLIGVLVGMFGSARAVRRYLKI